MIHISFQPVMCNFMTAYFLMLSDGIKKYAVSYVDYQDSCHLFGSSSGFYNLTTVVSNNCGYIPDKLTFPGRIPKFKGLYKSSENDQEGL